MDKKESYKCQKLIKAQKINRDESNEYIYNSLKY